MTELNRSISFDVIRRVYNYYIHKQTGLHVVLEIASILFPLYLFCWACHQLVY